MVALTSRLSSETSLDATCIVPVKPWRLAKSRLSIDDDVRISLARAFAVDTLQAISSSVHVGRIVIVSAELGMSATARRHGAVLVPDRPLLTSDGLNGAIAAASRWARARRPTSPLVVVPADMPALTPEVLDQALELMSKHSAAFVPDVFGSGTTLVWGRTPRVETSYGQNSAALHQLSGLSAVRGLDVRARLDVDTREDLAEALRLGVGRVTESIIATLPAARASI